MTNATEMLSSPEAQNQSPATSRGLPAWMEVTIVAAVFGGLLLGANLLSVPFGGPIALIASVIAITLFQRMRGEGWSQLGFKGPKTFASFGLGALVVLGTCFTAFAMNGVVQLVLNAVLENGVERTLPDVSTVANYITVMVIVWTTAAFAEEMVFRGFFINRLADVFGRNVGGWALAVILPAVYFGLAHAYQGLAGILITGSVGLVFGVWFLIAKRNLLPLIIAHGIINTLGMTVLFLVGQGLIQVEGL